MSTVKVIGLYEGPRKLYIGDVLDGPWYQIVPDETQSFADLAAAFVEDTLPSYMVAVPDPSAYAGVVAEMTYIVNQNGHPHPLAGRAARKLLGLTTH